MSATRVETIMLFGANYFISAVIGLFRRLYIQGIHLCQENIIFQIFQSFTQIKNLKHHNSEMSSDTQNLMVEIES